MLARKIGIVVCTGPSLSSQTRQIRQLQKQGALLFGVNNTYKDFDLDVWIACDPDWHKIFSPVDLPKTDCWHWSEEICEQHGYHYIEGVWMVDGKAYPRSEYITPPGNAGGLWIEDNTKLSLNHCSGAQALNLAVHYGCAPILLVGHDFKYEPDKPRHYFSDLSDQDGEYPAPLRKFSLFDKGGKGDDLLAVYRRIAEQKGLPKIINCTPGSAMKWLPMGNLSDYVQTD